MLRIDHSLCTGCGVCVDACPPGAIRLDHEANVATIDPALCNACLVCLDACPHSAIQQAESFELIPMVEGEIVDRPVTPVPATRFPQTLGRSGQLAALAGTALSFVGSWLVPRAADVLLDALERRLSSGSTLSSRWPHSDNQPLIASGQGRRGGRSRQRHRRRQGW